MIRTMAAMLLALGLLALGSWTLEDRGGPDYARNLPEKELMLLLTNQARAGEGMPPVRFGTNGAPQLHAENALGQCAGGHWDRRGLKPYMRYSLEGGLHPNQENWFNTSTCGGRGLWTFISGPPELVHDAIRMWLESPGHRESLMDPQHTHLSMGIAWDGDTFNAVQHFEKRRVEATAPPDITEGVLTLGGTLTEGPGFRSERDLVVAITWDPPPRPLEENRIARTSCYDHGELVMAVLPPRTPGSERREERRDILRELGNCPDPQLMDPGLPAPQGNWDLRRMNEEANTPGGTYFVTEEVHLLGALEWRAQGAEFQVRADISPPSKRGDPESTPSWYTRTTREASPRSWSTACSTR